MDGKDINRMLKEEHQKFEEENRVTIKMVCPDFVLADTAFSRTPEFMWDDYFCSLARRITGEHLDILKREVGAARKEAYKQGKSEAEIRGDGVPYRPEGK